jgi:hypothetical protein
MSLTGNTLCILDFDDTLFPTTNYKFILDSNNTNNQIKLELSKHVYIDSCILFIENACKWCEFVYIVTNASMSWIEMCLKVIPEINEIIIKKNIMILSSRDTYISVTTDPSLWKYMSFNSILVSIPDITNLISIGDGLDEWIASKWSSSDNNVTYKRIMMLGSPTVYDLKTQFDDLNKKISEIIFHPYNYEHKYEVSSF